MVNEWYKNPVEIEEKFKSKGEFENLKNNFLNRGIIYEGECGGLVTSNLIEHGEEALRKLFSNLEANYIAGTIGDPEWNYYLYNADMFNFTKAEKLAKDFFEIKG
ncbi:MAG: hypothetical protein Q3988_01195 [Gemella sp.]|nr:hypothetical protein [Gemella sp.]